MAGKGSRLTICLASATMPAMDMPARLWTSTTVSMHHIWQQSVDLRSEPRSDNLKAICFGFKTFACKVQMHEIRNHQVQHREYSLGSAMNQHLWQPWFSRWFFSRKLVHGVHGSNPQSAFEKSLNVSAMFLSTQFLQWMATGMRKWQEFLSCEDYTILTNGRQSKRQWADSPYPFRLLILAYHLTATQVANHKSCPTDFQEMGLAANCQGCAAVFNCFSSILNLKTMQNELQALGNDTHMYH